MGSTCKNICKKQIAENEFNINAINNVKKKQHSNGDLKTDPYCSPYSLMKEESIGDESKISHNQKYHPQFVLTKQINGIVVPTDRKNRFINDQELEIKYLIHQNLLKEQEEQKRLQEELEKQLQIEDKQNKEIDKSNEELNNQFSFQNSYKQIQIEQIYVQSTTNPYLPRQTSQFAPKKVDGDTISQKSQISKSPTTPLKEQLVSSQSDKMRKSALKKLKQSREDIASNNASIGSHKKGIIKKQQEDSFEKLFSECRSVDERSQSGSHKTIKSVKSILKKNRSFSQSLSVGKHSIKSTHTVFINKQTKKVRFSNNTNFNNERKGFCRVQRNWWEY